ncbi:interleukin-6 receptor subunit beta [Stegastes partitus]|uniref:Interleukin-6 receptor subunit beta-like n=1 Tax=Stegastes partitus TaxID=144197 RepID=A0A3B5A6J5_9TELE|nr:PREDICTED: interleukin-6 receptor subunit beta-like [Stegastes partitus]
MEWSPAVVCLIGAGLFLVLPPAFSTTTTEPFPRWPRLIGCEFMYRGNVTCSWEPGDAAATSYTLQVTKTPRNVSPKTFTCTTPETSCTAVLGSSTVRMTFCITVTAHSGGRNISSRPRCQPGRKEVILPPAILTSVKPARGSSHCLNVSWRRELSAFPVSDSEIKDGELNSQIEFTVQGQLDVQVGNVTVTGYSVLVCLFRPDTSYILRLRHRYQGPASPWSPWSNALQGRTGEDAPSAAPAFWRQVKQTNRDGWRLISLLWKPLPHFLANGRVLFYNVTCQTDGGQVLSNHGSCRDLQHSTTSCSLLLPAGRCSCALTASTSAGTSPPARMLLPGASEKEPPSPGQIAARPLDDSSIEVSWTAPVKQPVSGFVVEWFAVTEGNSSVLHWEKLNGSHTALVITEGVKPMERYAVSVKALYGERDVGKNRTLQIYTRQGTPSAGPDVKVQWFTSGTVELGWSSVPVERLRGFLRNYTLCYATRNQAARSE